MKICDKYRASAHSDLLRSCSSVTLSYSIRFANSLAHFLLIFNLLLLNELTHPIYWKILISILGMPGYVM